MIYIIIFLVPIVSYLVFWFDTYKPKITFRIWDYYNKKYKYSVKLTYSEPFQPMNEDYYGELWLIHPSYYYRLNNPTHEYWHYGKESNLYNPF